MAAGITDINPMAVVSENCIKMLRCQNIALNKNVDYWKH